MNDVARLILEAWDRLGEQILADPHELAKRLARRRGALLTRPPRAWCLAVRASDRRITPAHWVISPEHAMDLDHPEHPYEPIEHEVIIRPHALRKYCRPVRTDEWGEEVHDVCAKLGVSPSHLRNARLAGLFSERFYKSLGGKHGRYPVPLIHSWTTLDPSSGRHFSRPDPLWGGLWEFLPDRIPDDFEQTILRRPHFGRKIHARTSPTGELYKDDLRFIGWRWVCPACNKEKRTIYYPSTAPSLFEYLGSDPAQSDADRPHQPPATFACWSCHRIDGTSRATNAGWNQIVSHMTTGLLYGHEVEKPHWYRPQRKNARWRNFHAAPALKREAVFVRLMNGWTPQQIVSDLRISKDAVELHIQKICRQERVKNRHELAAKLGWKHPQPLNGREKLLALAKERQEQVLPFILQGLTRREIARRTGLTHSLVQAALVRIYKKHGLAKKEGKRALGRKFGLQLPWFGTGLGERRSKRMVANVAAHSRRRGTAHPLHMNVIPALLT